MSGRLDYEKEGKRKLVETRGAEPIAPGERTLSARGFLHPNKKKAKNDPRPAMDVSPLVFKQEDLETARQAILRTERDKQERKRAKAAAVAGKPKAPRARHANAKAAAKPSNQVPKTASGPTAVMQHMPRGRTREVVVETKPLPPSPRPARGKPAESKP